MKILYNSKFGKVPYKDVILMDVSFDAKDQSEVSEKQYNLLLQDDVIQAHLEFSTRTGIIIFSMTPMPEDILRKIGLKFNTNSKQVIPYEKVITANFMHKE